ncbi:GntR family transcriptional regulator [Azospirillum picis]|uniref:DNA-binding GntR family transcriptional regulator n=1 Tax=Azospirillum picis TaxID=488438 RepID=A0ABU0MDK9_9PROT|nr:GntR family transcriptional regulator [Azospirillum picis]MBP2297509.1 DNA-binding GntR family transcriptional regulator [Azospirillum picis]MDQ0531468.1 DNA-binding GntR family transcriptional regulator [Azospirillum picis]
MDSARQGKEAAKATGGVNLADMAYRTLLEMILDRRLRSGELIVEDRLATALSISRTPLREALVRLASEGLIRKEFNRPYRVREVSSREYFQSMRLREILEGEAIATAAARIDPVRLQAMKAEMLRLRDEPQVRFEDHWAADEVLHTMIAEASGNEVMAQIIRDLRVTTRLFELSGLPSRIRPDCLEHLEVIDALADGDPAKARAAMESHIRSLAKDVLNDIARA